MNAAQLCHPTKGADAENTFPISSYTQSIINPVNGVKMVNRCVWISGLAITAKAAARILPNQ